MLASILIAFVATDVSGQTGSVTYVYDALGRFVGVIDQTGAAAIYTYDAVGNLLSIQRQDPGTVSIIAFTPTSGPPGASVTISGTGFSATPSQNTLTFSGVAATVSSATPTQLVVTVPTGATTGPIAVTTPSGSASSASSFVVTADTAPSITSFSPTIAAQSSGVTITGTNFDTTPAYDILTFNVTLGQTNTATATTLG